MTESRLPVGLSHAKPLRSSEGPEPVAGESAKTISLLARNFRLGLASAQGLRMVREIKRIRAAKPKNARVWPRLAVGQHSRFLCVAPSPGCFRNCIVGGAFPG
jgi:hypothetical protein